MRKTSNEENFRRLAMYDAGESDGAIARACGATRIAVSHWRIARRLPSKHPVKATQIQPEVSKGRMALYLDGATGAQIASVQGVSEWAVHRWRQRQGLPANHHGGSFTPEQRAARMLLYSFGYSDSRIAHEQRVGAATITKWRKRLNLPANRSPARRTDRIDKAGDMLARIKRAVGRGLPGDIADDAIGDLCIAALSGEISIDEIEKSARKFGNKVLSSFADKWGARSLDEEIGEEPGFMLLDTLQDESSSSWLEEMGATVW
jgi:hypothetical protein